MHSNRLRCIFIALCMVLSLPGLAMAQVEPSVQPIRIVVPFPAGGGQDAVARYFAERLAPRIGRAVIVENRAGAGGVLATASVANSPPASNQFLLASAGPISIAPNLRDNLPYSPKREFKPVVLFMDSSLLVGVSATSKYMTIADFLQDARNRPGKVTYSSLGPGSNTHMLGELLAATTSVHLLHVPYKEFGPAFADVVEGRIDSMVITEATALPMVASGKLRILGTFTERRSSNLPTIPTLKEGTGLPGLVVPAWGGLLAPSRAPPTLVNEVAGAMLSICQEAATRAFLAKNGAATTCAGPAEFQKLLDADFDRWHDLIRKENIKIE